MPVYLFNHGTVLMFYIVGKSIYKSCCLCIAKPFNKSNVLLLTFLENLCINTNLKINFLMSENILDKEGKLLWKTQKKSSSWFNTPRYEDVYLGMTFILCFLIVRIKWF